MYLLKLAERLSQGTVRLTSERRERHRAFLSSQRIAGSGFRGREGDADLYYSSFAVRALHLVGGLTKIEATELSHWLQGIPPWNLNVIDLLSWLTVALAAQTAGAVDPLADFGTAAQLGERLAEKLEALRRPDGGYAKATEGAASSTYHSFLVALTYELIGRTLPRPNALVQFIFDRQRDDGGFVEIAPMRNSGTNPTAAAVALLQMFHQIDDQTQSDLRDFLLDVFGDDGGFLANARIPMSDTLSTFTGLLTLGDLGLEGMIAPDRIRQFLTEVESPQGGFRAAVWDNQLDVEYTFYGLGILGLLETSGLSRELGK